MLNRLIVVVVACGLASAQLPRPGRCPKVAVVTEFDVASYVGTWHEQARYFAIFQLGGKCTQAQYSLLENGNISVNNTQINSLTGKVDSISGEASLIGKEGEAKLLVDFPSQPIPAELWVIGTDYSTYSVAYSCQNFVLFHTRNAWLLTRERNPDSSVIEKAYQVMSNNSLSIEDFKTTDQTDCTL